MKTIKLQLTKEPIDKASAGSSCCPVAQCLHVNGFPLALVGTRTWSKGFSHNSLPLTPSQRLIVRKFDADKPIRPCVILVNLPE